MATDEAPRVIVRQPTEVGPGAGRRLVLVHGSMDRATSFTRLMARLTDWTVVAYDRRGYAESSDLGPPESFEHQVQDLLEVLDENPAPLFGHSFGGDVVLAAAGDRPDLIPSAFVWEPPQPWLPWWSAGSLTGSEPAPEDDRPPDRAERFVRRMVGDRIWERLPPATRARRRSEGYTLEAEIASLDSGPVFDAASVRIPVTVGRGGRSSAYQRRAARELATTLPRGQLAEIPEAGHVAHLSHPGELASLIRKAVDRG